MEQEPDSKSDDSCSGYGRVDMTNARPRVVPGPISAAEDSRKYTPFIEALPFCDAMSIGFHTWNPQKCCYCPLGKHMKPWREIFGFDVYNLPACTAIETRHGPFKTDGLIAHLHIGEALSYHGVAAYYLSVLYPKFRGHSQRFADKRKRKHTTNQGRGPSSTGSSKHTR